MLLYCELLKNKVREGDGTTPYISPQITCFRVCHSGFVPFLLKRPLIDSDVPIEKRYYYQDLEGLDLRSVSVTPLDYYQSGYSELRQTILSYTRNNHFTTSPFQWEVSNEIAEVPDLYYS